ncbi:MAG: DUF2809 domain-containing protein [bacterium]|jgi:hypothetical protein|nr:DUF2809 domain-containing protein [bacterium]
MGPPILASLPRKRLPTLCLLLILIPLGLATKLPIGFGASWVNNHLGGVIYEVFWCGLLAVLSPKLSTPKIVLTVFLITCFLEVMQVWAPPFLMAIRSTYPGHLVLGSSFDPFDFIDYALGCSLAGIWLNGQTRIQGSPSSLLT